MPLLIIDDLGMRKLPHTAAEDLRTRSTNRVADGERASGYESEGWTADGASVAWR